MSFDPRGRNPDRNELGRDIDDPLLLIGRDAALVGGKESRSGIFSSQPGPVSTNPSDWSVAICAALKPLAVGVLWHAASNTAKTVSAKRRMGWGKA